VTTEISHVEKPAGIDRRSFLTRLVTSIVYAAVFLGCIFIGNEFFLLPLFCAFLCFLGCREFYQLASKNMAHIPLVIGFVIAISLPLTAALSTLTDLAPITMLAYTVITGMLALLCWVAFTATARIKDAAISLFGALYLGVPLASLILIRQMPGGLIVVLTTLISIWAADVFAYMGGSLLGRHKILPKISPKKSWEGFIAGMIGAVLIWIMAPLIFGSYQNNTVLVFLGMLITCAAFAGDLFESRMKREANVKDSGNLLPGHGGILDRIDSMLPAFMLVFLIFSATGMALG